jgi:hypothetical protein
MFLILGRNLREMKKKMHIGLHVKYLLLLSDFNETLIFSTGVLKTLISNVMKMRPVGAE